MNISRAAIGPTAGPVDQPRRVVLLDPAENLMRVELAPPLVEWDPRDDAGMIVVRIDQRLQLVAKVGGRFRRTLEVGSLAADVTVAVGHVLPHHQSQPVAMVVPAAPIGAPPKPMTETSRSVRPKARFSMLSPIRFENVDDASDFVKDASEDAAKQLDNDVENLQDDEVATESTEETLNEGAENTDIPVEENTTESAVNEDSTTDPAEDTKSE